MKKLTLILSLFVSQIGFAQLVDYVPGVVRPPSMYDIVKVGKDGTLFRNPYAKTTRHEAPDTLQKLNADNSIAFTQVFNFEQDENKIAIMIVHDKVYFFTSVYADKIETLYLRILDNATGKIITDRQKIDSTKGFADYFISLSNDETKLLIVSALQHAGKPQTAVANVFDAPTMKVVSTLVLPGTYKDQTINSYNYFLTDKGTVFFIIKPNTRDKEIPKTESFVLWDGKSTDFKYLDIAMDKKRVDNSYIKVKNGTFLYFGVFKDDHLKGENLPNKAGEFCVSVDLNDFKITRSDFNYFPEAMATKLSYKDGERNKDLGDKKFVGTALAETENGFYLIENLTYTVDVQSGNNSRSYEYSREFIISRFDLSGKLEFVKDIPKCTVNNLYGFDYLINKDNLYLVYCDHPDNLEKYTLENYDAGDYKNVQDYTGPVAVCVKLDSKGNASRQVLYRNETWCYIPGAGTAASDHKSIVIREVQKDQYRYSALIIK